MAMVATAGSASQFAAVAHVLGLTAAILVIVWVVHYGGGADLNSDNTDLIFNVHPLVMTLGFILVIGEAIMAYNTVPSRKTVQKSIHMLLHLLALGLGVLGIYAAFKFHNESQIPNMYTLHSWLGICTICLFGLQWIFGFLNFWFPGAPPMTRAMLVPLHAAAGLAIFLMAICTAETGFMEKGGGGPGAETRLINFAGLMILLFGLFVSLSTALPKILSL